MKGKGHRISASTLRNTAKAGQMEADGVLAMVRWLGLTLEHFTHGRPVSALLTSEMRGMRRFDTQAFYAAIDEKRKSQKMTWRDVSSQLQGFSPGMLVRLAKRGRLSIEQVVVLSAWLGLPAEEFTYPSRE